MHQKNGTNRNGCPDGKSGLILIAAVKIT